jgi:putative tryptophan/tyrosine transport system substrate-binding protein
MRRREFIAGRGSAAAWSLAAQAQQPAVPLIGFLHNDFPDRLTDRLRYFRQGLSEKGYVEGRNVAVEFRWMEGQLGLTADIDAQEALSPRCTALLRPRTKVSLISRYADLTRTCHHYVYPSC